MLEFRPIELSDKEWADKLMAMSNFKGSEYVFANNYNWKSTYHTQVARYKDFYIVMSGIEKQSYLFPSGSGDYKEVIKEIIKDAEDRGQEFHLRSITAEGVAMLETLFPDKFLITEHRGSADYIYNMEKLHSLAGKKLHGKRNHINRFKENYPNWVYEDMTEENIPECKIMSKNWCKIMGCNDNESLQAEVCAVKSCFSNFTPLKIKGGLLREEKDGKILAFTMGSATPNCDTLVVHVEKAYPDIQGAYPMINQQFVISQGKEYSYINREDDLGEEGLRKAKLSYYPDILEIKYSAHLK